MKGNQIRLSPNFLAIPTCFTTTYMYMYMYMFPSFLTAGLIYSLMKKEVGVEMEMCMGPVPTTLMCIKLS